MNQFINKIICDNWHGCYDDSWQGIIVPEAFAHPAKMAYGLTSLIFHHALSEQWIKAGDVVVDPFGGIGSTGILGACNGLNVICVELETKFYRMANSYECPGITKKEWTRWFNRFGKNPDICPECNNEAQGWYEKNTGIIPLREAHHYVGNFEKNRLVFEAFGKPVYPVIIQGDSRNLSEIIYAIGISNCDFIVGSPPFIESLSGKGKCPENRPDGSQFGEGKSITLADYGQTPGQLGAMKPGKLADVIISSPPYSESLTNESEDQTRRKQERISKSKTIHNGRKLEKPSPGKAGLGGGYGQTKGNLGNLKPGILEDTIINHKSKIVNPKVDAVISSPPFMLSDNRDADKSGFAYKFHGNQRYGDEKASLTSERGGDRLSKEREAARQKNVKSIKNLGNIVSGGNSELLNTETFWQAARQIVCECHKILKDGGYAIWVVKDFVRNKKKVDFTGDWRRLCESVGFKTLHEHHAMLVKEISHNTLFGHKHIEKKERKSFFRRLAESKGSPKIDYEVVLCMRKKNLEP